MIAVISDIHGGLPRLQQGLQIAHQRGADSVWCLGDIVGYERNDDKLRQSVELVRSECDLVLSGNHDLAATGQFADFLRIVPMWLKASLLEVKKALTDEQYAWLKSLKPKHNVGKKKGVGVGRIKLAHGSLANPEFGDCEDPQSAFFQFMQQGKVSLVGHTHAPMLIKLQDEQIAFEVMEDGQKVEWDSAEKLILNPGTLGLQQRQGVTDRRPGFMLLTEQSAEWVRLPAPEINS